MADDTDDADDHEGAAVCADHGPATAGAILCIRWSG